MKNILRELLAAEQPITGTYLANVNQVTPRTTRDDIKHLDAILHQHGATIVSVISSHVGRFLRHCKLLYHMHLLHSVHRIK